MEHEQWLEILSTINADNDLNESNVIEKIREKLKTTDQNAYEEWKKTDFDVNHVKDSEGWTLLHFAAKNGRTEIVEALVKNGADVNTADKDGYTSLHFAAENGHTEIVEALVKNVAKVDVISKYEWTPLHRAVRYGCTEVVKALINSHVEVNEKDRNGYTPLHWAVTHSSIEVVKALIENGAEVNAKNKEEQTPLHWAARYGHTEVVKTLIENEAEVSALDNNGYTPLHWAAEYGHTEVVEVLIDKGAKVNALNQHSQQTLLEKAVKLNHISLVQALVKEGVDVHALDKDGNTVLYSAIIYNLTEVVKALIENEAEVNVLDENGYTPLHWAAEYGHTEVVKALIAKGAEVNAANEDGWTPLHLAARYGHSEVVKTLIENEAGVNALDNNGYTPLHLAVTHSSIEVVKALIAKGAEVNALDNNGYTPLHLVAEYGHTEVVEVLIDKGAKVNALNQHSQQTLLEKAVKLNHTSLVQTLVKNGADVNAIDSGKTLLCYAVESDHKEIATLLMNKGADPLLVKRNAEGVKYLVELIKNDILECPEKVEKTQQEEKQINDEYEFIKCSLLSDNSSLIDVVTKGTFDSLICKWLADVHTLTESQKKLNTQLLILLKDFLYHNHSLNYYNQDQGYDWIDSEKCNVELRDFLEGNRSNEDLETILNLQRGESQLTILHLISGFSEYQTLVEPFLDVGADPSKKDGRGRTPLHYATNSETIKFLLDKGADLNIKDIEGKTPRDIAIDSHNYGIEQYFFTSEQQRLKKELYDTFWLWEYYDSCDEYYDPSSQSGPDIELMKERLTELKDLLNKYKHENAEDLKIVLNLRDSRGESKSFQSVRDIFGDKDLCKEAESLLLEAGAIDYKEGLDRKEHSPKLGILWDNLVKDQQEELEMFVDKVKAAQNMNELEQVVDEAIKSGLALNFPHQGKLYGKMYESKYSFTDCVISKIKGISESEKNPKLASDIVCKLISKGAKLTNICSLCVFDELEKFEGHKANIKRAHEDYVHRTLEFTKVVKSAASGRLKDARMDTSTFYLRYSKDSTVKPAEIINGAMNLGLIHGKAGYGRNVIKIGKSEVEIITENGIRNYTDFADNSDIVLTFYTSLGELEVRLYPDKQNKDLIRVEIRDQEMWKKLKDCKEQIGKNCRFGGLSVNDAIGQGFFGRSGKLMRPEAMRSQVNSSLGDISLSSHIKESIQQIQSQGV